MLIHHQNRVSLVSNIYKKKSVANIILAQQKKLENLAPGAEAYCQDTWNLVKKVQQQLLLGTMEYILNRFKAQ